MPKSFDPDKARSEAKAVIANATKRKEALNLKVTAAEASVKKANDRLETAKAAVASVDGEISRAERYLAATADLDAPVAVEPVDETGTPTTPEPVGAF